MSFIYPCILCDFSDTEQGNLQNHIESIHMDVKQELKVKDEVNEDIKQPIIKNKTPKRPSNQIKEKEVSGREESLLVFVANESKKYFDQDPGSTTESTCKICGIVTLSRKGSMKKHLMENHLDIFQSFKKDYYKVQLQRRFFVDFGEGHLILDP